MVIELIRRLERLGRHPAVVSRGYKARAGKPNDEERLIRRHCPGVVCVAGPDRRAAAERAHRHHGADVIVLDDGFQHRSAPRDLDIVMIDATCPFGHGHMLPRGLLREPPTSLRRAGVVVLSRCDQGCPEARAAASSRLETLAPEALHLQCRHRVTSIETLSGGTPEGKLHGKRAVLFAAIGNPASFAETARSLGVVVVGERWWPDHHAYESEDIRSLRPSGRFPPHDILLTTEKDAVKLSDLPGVDPEGILVVRVSIDFIGDGGTILDAALARIL